MSDVSGPTSGQQSLSGSSGRRLSSGKKRRPARRRQRSSESGSSRKVSSSRLLFLLFAAGLSAAVILVLSSTDDRVYVVRFVDEMPSLSLVGGSDLEAAPVPTSAIEPDTFSGSDPEALLSEALEFVGGRWLAVTAWEGQQLRASMFAAAGELKDPLAPTERLVSVSSPAPRSVAGRIRAGDRVDVYVASPGGLAGILGQDVEVVSVSVVPSQFDSIASQQLSRPGEGFDDIAPRDPVPGTYVLRVPADRVGDYVSADVSGRIYLALRGPEAADMSALPSDLTTIICSQTPYAPACASVVQPGMFPAEETSSPASESSSPSEQVISSEEEVLAEPEGDGSGQE